MEIIGTTDISNRITELLDRTAHGEAFEIIGEGHPPAVLLSADEYRKLKVAEPTFTDFLIDVGPRFDDLELPSRPAVPMRDLQL